MTVGSRGRQQGTCHIVGADTLDRQMLYVAMSRGVDANHLYLGTSESDPHKIIYDRAQRPPTAVDMVRAILARDGRQTSAATIARTDTKASTHLAHAADSYATAVASIAEAHLGPKVMEAIDNYAETLHPGLTTADAWPTLRKHLAVVALSAPAATDRADHAALRLQAAIGRRELDTATDPAAVLDWRLDHTGKHSAAPGPLPWLTGIPDELTNHPAYGDYLHRRRQLVTGLADNVRADTPTTMPQWRQRLADLDPELLADIAVFRAAHRIPDTDSRPLGQTQPGSASRRAQTALDDRIAAAHHHARVDEDRWSALATSIDPHLLQDPFWPELARALDQADARGIHVEPVIEQAAARHALPTEIPAAALWWRAADDLGADPIHAARQALDAANMRLADHRLATLSDTLGAEHTTRWAQNPHRDDLMNALAAAHTNTGMNAEHLIAAAGRGRDTDELTTMLRNLGTVTDPRPEPAALPVDNTDDIHAARAAHQRYRALVDQARTDLEQTPPTWLNHQLGDRPTQPDTAAAWDNARARILDYHAEYGHGDEALPALPDNAHPAQMRAHDRAHQALDDLDRKRRQEHLDRLAHLEQQHQQQLADEQQHQTHHMPPPQPHPHQGRHM